MQGCGQPAPARRGRGQVVIAQDRTPASFAALSEDQRVQAMARLTVLRPYLDDGGSPHPHGRCRRRAAADGAALARAAIAGTDWLG